jgi:uncharacterized integral membrane protein (TIGR00698 family)
MFPGLFLTATIALAVSFVSANLGGPAMLYALLFGMIFNFLFEDERLQPGVRVSSRSILRLGVALLGARITAAEVADLGWPVVILIGVAVAATILVGWALGRLCGLRNNHSVLSSSAVAICGASAALAVASVLPDHKHHERNTSLTVVGVTALSTVAMVLYPVFVAFVNFDDSTAGIFLGATIHDVAQVVGAGYIVSEAAGDTSTLVKLIRVAFLVPVILTISLLLHTKRGKTDKREPLLPWFLIAFVLLVVVNSLGWVPDLARNVLSPASSWCLLIGVAALGVKTSLKSVVEVGIAPIGAMVLQTLFLAAFVLGGLYLLD